MFRPARKSDIGGYTAASDPVTLKPRCLSMPASDAIAVPQMPMRWTCCCDESPARMLGAPSRGGLLRGARRRCGLQHRELHLLFRVEPRAHADRQRDVLAGDVSGFQPGNDRDAELADDTRDDFIERVLLVGVLFAIEHLAEDDPTHALELSCQTQLHQHAIDLVWLRADVFDEKNGAISLDLVRRS